MVKMLEIREMVRLVDQSSLDSLEVKNEGLKILIKKGKHSQIVHLKEPSTQLGSSVDVQITENSGAVKSKADLTPQPCVLQSNHVGTFQSLAKPGDKVENGSLIGRCSVKALNLNYDITSMHNGVISEVLVEEGQLIDYGHPIFKIIAGKELVHV